MKTKIIEIKKMGLGDIVTLIIQKYLNLKKNIILFFKKNKKTIFKCIIFFIFLPFVSFAVMLIFFLIIIFYFINLNNVFNNHYINDKLKKKTIIMEFESLKGLKTKNKILSFVKIVFLEKSRKEAFNRVYKTIQIIKMFKQNKGTLNKKAILIGYSKNLIIFLITGYTKLVLTSNLIIVELFTDFFFLRKYFKNYKKMNWLEVIKTVSEHTMINIIIKFNGEITNEILNKRIIFKKSHIKLNPISLKELLKKLSCFGRNEEFAEATETIERNSKIALIKHIILKNGKKVKLTEHVSTFLEVEVNEKNNSLSPTLNEPEKIIKEDENIELLLSNDSTKQFLKTDNIRIKLLYEHKGTLNENKVAYFNIPYCTNIKNCEIIIPGNYTNLENNKFIKKIFVQNKIQPYANLYEFSQEKGFVKKKEFKNVFDYIESSNISLENKQAFATIKAYYEYNKSAIDEILNEEKGEETLFLMLCANSTQNLNLEQMSILSDIMKNTLN